MAPLEVFIIILSILAVLIVFAYVFSSMNRKKNIKIIHSKIVELFPYSQIKILYGSSYQIEIETPERIILVKIVPFNPNHELIITNPHYWCINPNIKNWKRSEKPVLVEKVREFNNLVMKSEKKIIKVGLIYPNCYNITRYLNESDVEIVTYKKPAYGVYFVRFSEIELFFKN